jgi:putative FmdB family regulatory protein
MPTYQYRCPACGHVFERFEKMNAAVRAKCPKCGKRAERQISGGAGLVFKGSGFYATDYKRKESPKDSERSDKPAASDKSDKKPPPKAPGAE